MATKRQRNGAWAYTVRRGGLLPKPLYLTFDDEREGDAYVAKLEALLDKGVVPQELLREDKSRLTLHDLIESYLIKVNVSVADQLVLKSFVERVTLSALDYAWVEAYVDRLKEKKLAPSTIRHKVGAVSRAVNWGLRSSYCPLLVSNPFTLLPHRYATGHREDVSRDRRLEGDEEKRILALLEGEYRLLFVLAVETAMRMSEMYSLLPEQVDIARRTVFLDKTKNGDKRQVPMSSVVARELEGFAGFSFGPRGAKTTSQLSVYFGRVFKKAGCPDLNFHDLRHEATCRLFEKTTLSDLQIATITGHRDPRMLKRYANLRGSDLAMKMW